jgi:hypothetical protein
MHGTLAAAWRGLRALQARPRSSGHWQCSCWRPVPPLALPSCAACGHALRQPTWRPGRGRSPQRPQILLLCQLPAASGLPHRRPRCLRTWLAAVMLHVHQISPQMQRQMQQLCSSLPQRQMLRQRRPAAALPRHQQERRPRLLPCLLQTCSCARTMRLGALQRAAQPLPAAASPLRLPAASSCS